MSQDTEPLSRESQTTTNTILLVEDDPNIGSFLVEAIAQETPYRAIVASDSHAALKLVRHFTPCLFILDYGLPGMNGIELYDRLHINLELAPSGLDHSESPSPSAADTTTPAHHLHQTTRIGFIPGYN
jgi:CheY-like chemotaxis protein